MRSHDRSSWPAMSRTDSSGSHYDSTPARIEIPASVTGYFLRAAPPIAWSVRWSGAWSGGLPWSALSAVVRRVHQVARGLDWRAIHLKLETVSRQVPSSACAGLSQTRGQVVLVRQSVRRALAQGF
jgi:hypothetical protein